MLDDTSRQPVTWISGPGGAGKTTLVASWLEARKLPCIWYQVDEGDSDLATFFYYFGLAAKKATPRIRRPLPFLTPEYLQGVATFTKRYFEKLCARLNTPFVIVFDNYHLIPERSSFHEMLRDALPVIPDGIHVVINSRGAPPPPLAALSAYRKVGSLGWEDLKFNGDEIEGLFKSEHCRTASKELLKRVQTITTGWAAGLVLMLQHLRTPAGSGLEPEPLKSEAVFDYFTAEFFDKIEPETQMFLLQTSFLPHVVPAAATLLTGNGNAAKLLADLSKNHFFTERRSLPDPVYQYHPLFREFLQARAKETLAHEDVLHFQRRAAELLESSGQIEDAADLCRTAEAWDLLGRIILANAQAMMSQGRHRPLGAWLGCLPDAVIEKEAWLLYWMGVCRMPSQLAESHIYFARALDLFRERHDATGVFRSWSGAIESLVQEMGDIRRLNQWVALAFDLMNVYPFPSRDIEDEVTARIFTAMPWNPADSNFVDWRRRATQLIESDTDTNLRMMTSFYLFFHFVWTGDYATATGVLDIIMRLLKTHKNISPLAHSMGSMCDGWFAWLTGDLERSLSIMADALAKSSEAGVPIWDRNLLLMGAGAALCRGDLVQSGRLLEQMADGIEEARLFDRSYYHGMKAWRLMLMGDSSSALNHEEKALENGLKTGFPITAAEGHFGMALVMRERKERQKAKEHAVKLHTVGSHMGSTLAEYKALLIDALLDFDEGKKEAGMKSLDEALRMGRERGFVYFKWWLPSMMTSLCMKALEAGIEIEYVRGLIKTCGLVPEEPPLHIENWPWPVRIFTLGEFRILLDDKPVAFTGKVQKKPLELLKALIAFGGINVAEERIVDALWPDADGDTARQSFKTTLHRLRQLLGRDELVALQEGRLSLDQKYCWTDSWAFEKLLLKAEIGLPNAESNENEKIEKALVLYRGHFLVQDEDKPWAVSMREHFKRKFVQAINKAGEQSERETSWNKAISVYERGLEVDDLAEEFYHRLMVCHLKLGRKADAVKTYKRCHDTLKVSLGVGPSEETEGIYRLIDGQREKREGV